MAQTYKTQQSDELDDICFRFYGYTNGSVEAVLDANRDLAQLLPILPEGVLITLPDVTPPASTTVLKIWN